MEEKQLISLEKKPLLRRISHGMPSFFTKRKVTPDIINSLPEYFETAENASPSSVSDNQSSNYDSPIISSFEPSPVNNNSVSMDILDKSNPSISSLDEEEHYQNDITSTDDNMSDHWLDTDTDMYADEDEHIALVSTGFHWALLHFPPTIKNAGIILFASGLTLLAAGFITSASVLITTGTAIAGVGALLSFYGHYNPRLHQPSDATSIAESIHYPTPASSVV